MPTDPTSPTQQTSDAPVTPATPTAGAPEQDRAGGTWHAGVLLFEGAEPLDAIGPAQVLWSLPQAAQIAGERGLPDVRVHLVAESPGLVTAAYGLALQTTVGYADCPPLDLLVVPGGGYMNPAEGRGVAFFQSHEPTLAFVRRQAEQGALLTSVCTGAFILARAGLLAGRQATTHWLTREALVGTMAARGEAFELVEERVVDDGDLVTAGGVSSGIDLALHVVTRTFGQRAGEAATLLIERETPVTAP